MRCLSFRGWGGCLKAITPEAPTYSPGQDVPCWGGSWHCLLLLELMLPCLNGMPLDHLDNLIYLRRCWVRQISPKSKGKKIQNLHLSCRIKVRFKSGRNIKGFRAQVFFQRGKRTKESSLLK